MSRSLFQSTDVATLRHQYPDHPVLHALSDDTRLVVAEPLRDLQGWLDRYREFLGERYDRLDEYLRELQDTGKEQHDAGHATG